MFLDHPEPKQDDPISLRNNLQGKVVFQASNSEKSMSKICQDYILYGHRGY